MKAIIKELDIWAKKQVKLEGELSLIKATLAEIEEALSNNIDNTTFNYQLIHEIKETIKKLKEEIDLLKLFLQRQQLKR